MNKTSALFVMLALILLSSCSKKGFDDDRPREDGKEEATAGGEEQDLFPYEFHADSTAVTVSPARMAHLHASVRRIDAATGKSLAEDGIKVSLRYGATADTASFVVADATVTETVNEDGYGIDSYAVLGGDARKCYLLLKLESKAGRVATSVMRVNIPSLPAVARQEMEAVDLGLSVLWGKVNLGAETEDEAGGYFAFGEIAPRSSFVEERWSHFNVGLGVLLGSVSGVEGLDAALAACGEGWRLPTYDEARELGEKCEWNGVAGPAMRFVGENGESISLPCGGIMAGRRVVHNDNFDGYDGDGKFSGYYLTGTVGQEPDLNCALRFDMKSNGADGGVHVSRESPSWMGHSVRPVRDR